MIDFTEISRILEKYYNPSDPMSRFMWKNPSECVRFHFAFVEDNKDPDKKGRLKLRFPHWEKNMVTDWCPIIRPFSGKQMGMFVLPEIDEPVMCVFINDNPQKPLVLGSLRRKGVDKPPVGDNPNNDIKKIVSRAGTTILMNDKDGEEVLEIKTKDEKFQLTLDKNKGIKIVNMNGDIRIKCKKFTMEGNDTAQIKIAKELAITSDNDEIKISSTKDLQFKSGAKVDLKGSSKIKIKGMCAAGNKAIAKKDDQVVGVDIHQVKVPSGNGTVDVPLPHPYVGKLQDQLSNDVENDNKAVAMKGSKSKYSTPGHIPTPPGIAWSGSAPSNEGEVTQGTEATVKVNDKEIAVLGSMVKTCNFPNDVETCTVIAAGAVVKVPIIIPGVTDPEQFEKDGGMVVNANNLVAPANQQPRSPKFTTVKWSKSKAEIGEEIILEADLSDQYENAGVDFKIYNDGADVEKDKPVKIVKGQNKGGKAEAKWRYGIEDFEFESEESEIAEFFMDKYGVEIDPEAYKHVIKDYKGKYENPLQKTAKFFFQAWSFKCEKKKSDNIEIGEKTSIEMLNAFGGSSENVQCSIMSPDGNESSGSTDKNGLLNKDALIPGKHQIKIKIDNK